ncbi:MULTISPECIES: SipW-dependent-type signal peptide-containing protein [unclassified Agrococcus]|uniref:SipW-dependent-type signal peptide-containing protein n=1 Tax=unclassified Agrococcus TaxID=2615065 RepID=UPI003607C970
MSINDVEAVASPGRSSRGRKVRAMLAGGLVLGVGAAITLAAWTDSEFATGTFTAGAFNLEGSTTAADSGYDDHNVEDGDAAASLEFTLDLNANLTPDDVTYAPFWVRLDATTTTAATLDLTSIVAVDGTPGNAANLAWTVVSLDDGDACDAAGVAGGTVMGSGGTLTTDAAVAGATEPLAIGTTPGTAGAPVPLCFAVTAGPDLVQTGSATGTWQLLATSI